MIRERYTGLCCKDHDVIVQLSLRHHHAVPDWSPVATIGIPLTYGSEPIFHLALDNWLDFYRIILPMLVHHKLMLES